MSGKAVFTDKSSNFRRKNDAFIDFVLGHMTQDMEVYLKVSSGMPVDKGQMKASTRHFRNARGKFQVIVNKEYAAYQERGMDKKGKRVVKNYTTAGTGAGFFARTIDAIGRQRSHYLQMGRKAVGL